MIELRDVEPADREMLREWRNRPEVARYMHNDAVITPEQHARWFDAAMADPSRRYWIIRVDGTDVGLADVHDIDHVHSCAMWAFYLADTEVRGRGVGTYVEYRVLRHVFDELGLNRLGGEVLASNTPVLRMHEAFGFQREGTLRQRIRKGEGFVDVVVIGMLRSEWLERRDEIRRRVEARGLP
jgi:UDP-4-amino-4,6-dideoxy-N-acetyl-beta-L-altrosamine N-acetyltransferase